MQYGRHGTDIRDRRRTLRDFGAAALVALACALPACAPAIAAPPQSGEQLRWLVVVVAVASLYLLAIRLIRARARRVDADARDQRQVRMLVVVFVLLFVGTVLGNLLYSLHRGREATLERARLTTQDLALVLARQAAGTIDSVDFALGVIAGSELLQSGPATDAGDLQRLLAGVNRNLTVVEALWITDARGRVLPQNGRVPGAALAAGHGYFELARLDPSPTLHIGPPRHDASGHWFLPVSRRIERDGRFAGVVGGALRLHSLDLYAHSLDLGRSGFVALMRTDGTVIQQDTNMPAAMIGRRLLPPPPYVAMLAQRDAGSYRNRHPIDDGAERIVSFRRLPGRDLVVLVSVGVDEALASWNDTVLGYLVGTLLFLALIIALALRLLRTMDRQREQQVRIARLSRMHALLSGVNALIVRTTSRRELFDGACRIAVEQAGVDVAWIDEYDAATGTLTPVASAGADAAYILDGESLPVVPGRVAGVPAQALARHAAASSGELQHSAGCAREQRAVERGYHSAFTVPLFRHRDMVAALSLLAHPPNYFDEAEVRLLDELAGDLSYALDHLATVERIEYLHRYDALTGLPNRTLFLDRLVQCLNEARGEGSLCAVVKIDIERFRQINDAAGWDAGDRLLQDVAERLRHALGESALVGRTERDHFVFVVSDVQTEDEAASTILQQLQACFAAPLQVGGRSLHIAARAGAAMFPADGQHADVLLRNAEAAMARAKHRAERLVFYAPAMNARVAESLAIENRLRTALERDEFVLHYQPKFDARTGDIVGLEALLRWNDPDSGLMPPAHFIGVLEETGLILDVGDWVMRQAVHDHRHWRRRGLRPPRIAVNVSAIQLQQDSFAETVRDALDGDLGVDGLELEITESMLMTRIDRNADKLDAVRGMGVHIAIDDFGTGYSSLQYIAKLPLDTLKIDRSFVIGMTDNDTDREIVASVISLAHQLHLRVVAEGVDAESQARLLRDLDCDEMQGYLFSPPVPAEHIDVLLRRAQPRTTRDRSRLH